MVEIEVNIFQIKVYIIVYLLGKMKIYKLLISKLKEYKLKERLIVISMIFHKFLKNNKKGK